MEEFFFWVVLCWRLSRCIYDVKIVYIYIYEFFYTWPTQECFFCRIVCEFHWNVVNFLYFYVIFCDFLWFFCISIGISVNFCEFYVVLCVDTRPKLRVPTFVCRYASRIEVHIRVPTWRPELASQIDVPIRVPNELFIKVQFGVPTCSVCSCASQTTRPELRVQIRVPTTECCILCAIRVPTLCIRVPTFVYASQLCV